MEDRRSQTVYVTIVSELDVYDPDTMVRVRRRAKIRKGDSRRVDRKTLNGKEYIRVKYLKNILLKI